ncbi:UNVERIFIED_CONTAM: hypothetical protein HDU68_010546 [Siphonaria sp. JEL0065]|nr:hypothetical protein HDU68_010546 [Siphonaria sp. JEL0065]
MGPKKKTEPAAPASPKGKGKGKEVAPPPAPTIKVPLPGQKLTREEHAHNRMVRAKQAEDEKRELFGSWTGKVPLSVLFEHATRMEWDKPQVNSSKKGKGYVTSITLSKIDPKTRAKVHFTYTDPDYTHVYPTELEAKQWAATYVLHRVASQLSLHRLLPPNHQTFWAELEVIRKAESADVQKWEYAPDPFAVEELKLKESKEKQRENKVESNRAAKEAVRLSKPWEQYQKVSLSAGMRALVEDLIRGDLGEQQQSTTDSPRIIDLDESERSQILDSLVSKGFRRLHAEEALEYTSDVTSALNWLCIYVPEDDLPASFHAKPTNTITHGQSTTESLNRERAVTHMTQSGFNADTCCTEYDANGSSELKAIASLVTKLSSDTSTSPPPSNLDPSELSQSWTDELEAVESIFGTDAIRQNNRNHMVEITIDFSSTSNPVSERVQLHIGRPEGSTYPHELPAVLIVCPEIPAYIRLSLLRGLVREASQKWIGSAMLFEMVQWIQENFAQVVENPGVSLVELKKVVETRKAIVVGTVTKSASATSGNVKGGSAKKKTRAVETEAEIEVKGKELQQKYLEKIETAAYKTMLRFRQNLPSYKFRDQIINSVESNQVVIICGETGCGKSTQTGQFILEHLLSTGHGGACNMICTQPRRISAMALAERVAAERAETVGETIGYAIRGENVRGPSTRLIFATTGILLRMLQGDPSLNRVTHVIVDEVHERSVDSDFLLVILRDLVVRRPDFRLILMSATIDSETFSNYFNGAPVLNIPGFTHPVKDVYLEEILQISRYLPETRRVRPQQQQVTKQDIQKDAVEALRETYEAMSLDPKAVTWLLKESPSDAIDYSLVAATIRHVCETNKDDDGAILIFLQGAMEIKRCIDVIRDEVGGDHSLDLMPLHAQLSPKEQGSVFRRAKKGFRKVVVSTNVAETSITIDDVVFVIDAGRVKEMQFENSTLCLVDTLASRASCKQRRGRAGRVRPGTCYKLFSENLEQTQMSSHAVPEILRVPLEQLCLSLKAMGVEDVKAFLGKAITPPSGVNIENAVRVLRELHAVDKESEKLTPLGKHMASVPADLRLSKMLIFGSIFHCIHPVLTIAAILSSKSPFVAPFEKRDEAKAKRAAFLWDKSDLLTDAKAYDAWLEASKKGKRSEMAFCEENFLSSTALIAISDLRKQYLDNLVEIGFVKAEEAKLALVGGGNCNAYAKDSRVVKASIAAGLYPQIATIKHPDVTYVETAHGAVEREALPHEIEYSTENDGQVFLHPSSVLGQVTKYEDLFLCFHAKIQTSKVFLRDGTMISPWPILMFGGQLSVDHDARTVDVDGFSKFQAFPRIAVLVNGLRKQLDKALERKIRDPGLDVVNEGGSKGVGALLLKLFSEK